MILVSMIFFIFKYIPISVILISVLVTLWLSSVVAHKYLRVLLFLGALIISAPHIIIGSNMLFILIML